VGLKSLSILEKNGKMVTIPAVSAKEIIALGEKRNRAVYGMVVRQNTAQLIEMLGLIQQGRVTVTIGPLFPLEKAALAHKQIESGAVKRGKSVLTL
jgi:NADPH2:quinone reductase